MNVTDWETLIENYRTKYNCRDSSSLARDQVHRELLEQYPVYFASCVSICYSDRQDVYVGKFLGSIRTTDGDDCTLKLTHEVARFLLAHRMIDVPSGGRMVHPGPEVFLRLNDNGAVDDCVLVSL